MGLAWGLHGVWLGLMEVAERCGGHSSARGLGRWAVVGG